MRILDANQAFIVSSLTFCTQGERFVFKRLISDVLIKQLKGQLHKDEEHLRTIIYIPFINNIKLLLRAIYFCWGLFQSNMSLVKFIVERYA